MTQVLRIGFALAVIALASASASAQSDSATAGSSSAVRGQAGNVRTAMLDKGDAIARNGENTQLGLAGASRSAPSVAYGGVRSATPQLPADEKRPAKWSYFESLTEFLGFEGGSR